MNRILASVITLDQHVKTVATNSEIYRPLFCPHCGVSGLWSHGSYFRKADRSNTDPAKSLNPVPILRYLCNACKRTCSRLPACIAPRRWFGWAMQQIVLLMLLAGYTVRHCSHCSCRARSTVRRWRDWLSAQGDTFAFWLRSKFSELGRHPDKQSFWIHVMQDMTLMKAMACCDCHITVP